MVARKSLAGYLRPYDNAGGAKLFAPAAARNADALCAALVDLASGLEGDALEIASGSGQHMQHFAEALPKLLWQPSEVDAARRESIDAYIAEAGLSNVAPALHLDATERGWAALHGGKSLICLANLLHLISEPEARNLVFEASQALILGGRLALYGPFKRSGELTSDGDQRFDAGLRARDPAIGYKSDDQVLGWIEDAGLDQAALREMPANNLILTAVRRA